MKRKIEAKITGDNFETLAEGLYPIGKLGDVPVMIFKDLGAKLEVIRYRETDVARGKLTIVLSKANIEVVEADQVTM